MNPVASSVAGAEPITANKPPKIMIGNIEINVFLIADKCTSFPNLAEISNILFSNFSMI